MRGRAGLRACVTGLMAFGAVVFWAPVMPAGAAGPEPVADIAAPLLNSVVNISTSHRVEGNRRVPTPRVPEGSPFQDFFDEFFNQEDNGNAPSRRVQSLGSGFVIDAGGIIVTNNHVIADADEIRAIFNDGTELTATLIGSDEKTDIAVLRVEPPAPLTAVEFGDSDTLQVGDWVMAIGNPFGLGGSVTLGIVSARNRDIRSGPYDNFIQTDAAINRGNSGGPLFDMNGRVVGINTAIISTTGGSIGIGFAVPSLTASAVIDQLIEFGETRRGWLGVRIQEVSATVAASLGLDAASGALVAGVTTDGPAEAAGIEAGDVILEFGGERITTMNELPLKVAGSSIGTAVKVVVLRDGEEQELDVTLGWLEDAERLASVEEEPELDEPLQSVEGPFGLKLIDLSDGVRDELEINHSVDGVAVFEVEVGSLAEEKRFRQGDVIVEIAQERVATAADVTSRIDDLIAEGRRSALFLLANRDGDLRFVAVRLVE